MSNIVWPAGYVPGFTDNYVSNEITLVGINAADVWASLIDTTLWPQYYSNASDIHFYNIPGPVLADNARFRFTTFGFLVEAEVVEFVPPVDGQPARIAWHGWVEGNTPEERLDVHHAWLFEDLSDNQVRILTQETQNGGPAKALASDPKEPMLNAHQEWIRGLGKMALKRNYMS